MQNRWQAAIDELAKANAEFKKIEHPSDDQIIKQAKAADEVADRIKRLSKQLQEGSDQLMKFDLGGDEGEGREFPVLFCRREPLDRAVKASTGKDLAALEKEIDGGAAPKSCELPGWRIAGETDVIRERTAVKNVLGVLEGEGPHAEETIIIGAHYDHLGYGGSSSLARGVHAIHPGADDNASGDAALLEIARELAGFISGEVDRMNSLVTRFLDFSRPLNLRLENVDLTLVIDRVVEMVVRDTQSANQVFRNYSPDVPKVPADPDWVERVFYNLLLNSCQSVQARGGHVSVTVENSGNHLDIRVIDDGPGLDTSIRDKVFHPFVSHGKENGTGLGLTIAQKIVQDHSGQLNVEQSLPGCTVMRITLPCMTGASVTGARNREGGSEI